MKKLFFNYSLLLLVSLIFSKAHAQNTFRTTPTSVIGYLEYLPQNYNSNSDKYPVVIFLHGIGERGPASKDIATLKAGIGTVEKNGPPKHVKAGIQFPFILISPQLKSNYGDWPAAYVMEIIDYCKTYLRIDERRIYLTGLSLGGGGTWGMAQIDPKLYAAIAPVCGHKNSIAKAPLLAAENLPVWAFHGDKDTTVPMSRSIAMVNAINASTPKPSPLAKITIYPGVSHNSWENAYRPDHTLHNPNVYEWMLSYTNTKNGTNKIPLASAGGDLTIQGSSATISGSGSDSDGSITGYQWAKVAGPGVTLTNTSTSKLTVSNMSTGTYIFRLRVTDNSGNSDSDYIKVSVQSTANAPAPAPGNVAPVADAGPDRTVKLPATKATLFGLASDVDGKIVSYKWTKVSGGACTFSSTTALRPTISNFVAGTYVFRLTVTDDDGAVKTDDTTMIFENSSVASISKLPRTPAGMSYAILSKEVSLSLIEDRTCTSKFI